MSLVWAEPFDQYGGSTSLIASFGYSNASIANVNATGRTGSFAATISGANVLRRALNNSVTTLGQGFALNQIGGAFGSVGLSNSGLRWESAGNVAELTIAPRSDLSLGVWDRTGTLVGTTAPNQIFAGSFSWIEAKATGNSAGAGTGIVEVRINGVQKLIINGINLPNAFAFVNPGGNNNNGGAFIFDDWIVWDTNGTKNNDFMGDRRLFLSLPNANGVPQDFTASAGSAFDCVNNAPAVDTTFIQGAAGNVSEFSKAGVGIGSNDIAAMVICGRMLKSDAGVASGRLGVDSNGNIVNSPELFPGTTGAWFQQIQELDPNGNIPWARSAYDNANIVITRVQ